MNIELPDWPSVDVDRFVTMIETFEWERHAGINAIEFLDKRTGRIIGYEIRDTWSTQRGYLLHPDLVAAE